MSYFRLLITLSFCILLSIHSSSVVGQDELETARAYPPGMLNAAQLKTNKLVIDWKIEQLDSLFETYARSRKEIDVAVDSASHHVEALAKELPGELRFMDKETRSRLVGKLMESLLDARLELATRSKEVETLELRLSDKNIGRELESKLMLGAIAIRAADKKLEVATIEASKAQKLAKNGSKSSSELLMAQYTRDLAQLERESALAQLELLKNQPKADVANQVADVRVSVEPIKARIAAAEKFLATFTDSSETLSEIDSIKRSIELYEKDRLLVAMEMSSLSRNLEELRMLQSRISKRIMTNAKKGEEK